MMSSGAKEGVRKNPKLQYRVSGDSLFNPVSYLISMTIHLRLANFFHYRLRKFGLWQR